MKHAPGQVGEIALEHLRILLDCAMELMIQRPSRINPGDYRMNDKKFVAEVGKAISRLWLEDQNRRKLIETRIRQSLPDASEEEIARRTDEISQSKTHYPEVDGATLRVILDHVSEYQRLKDVDFLSHRFLVGNMDPAEDDLRRGKMVGFHSGKPEWPTLAQLIAGAVDEVKKGEIYRKEEEREWIYAQILVARTSLVQQLDKRFSGAYGREKRWDEEARKTDQPISLGEMLGRLQEKMKDEHLTVVREFGEPPWKSRHNLIPNGRDLSERYADYLEVRGQIEHLYVLKCEEYGRRYEAFCEAIQMPGKSSSATGYEEFDPVFPMGDADWEDLTITFLQYREENVTLRFELKKGMKETFKLKEVGLQGPKGVNQVGNVLQTYAYEWTSNKKTRLTQEIAGNVKAGNFRKIISEIRKTLQKITGLTTDPFDDDGSVGDGYQLHCRLKSVDCSNIIPRDDALHPEFHSDKYVDEICSPSD